MRLRRLSFVLAVLVSLSTMLAIAEMSSAGGKAKNWVIVATGKERQRRIGPYFYVRNRPGGEYAAVTKAFGTPTSRSTDANDCVLRWKSLGLQINLGVGSSSPCSADSLKRDYWYGTKISSRIWRTDRGLRVGDSQDRLQSLYPDAKWRSGPRCCRSPW